MLHELLRVAEEVLVTVPNRFLPIAHVCGPTFRLACRLLRKEAWAQPENLILMFRRSLDAVVASQAAWAALGPDGLRLGPFSSNLFLHIARC